MVTTGTVEIAAATGMAATGQRTDGSSDDSAFAQLLGEVVSDDTVAAPAVATSGSGKSVKAAVSTGPVSPETSPAEILALLGLPVTTPANTQIQTSMLAAAGALTDAALADHSTAAATMAVTASASDVVAPQQTQNMPVSTPTAAIDSASAKASPQAADLQWLQRGVRGETGQEAVPMDSGLAANSGTGHKSVANGLNAATIPAQHVAGQPGQHSSDDAATAIDPTVVPDSMTVTQEQQSTLQNTPGPITPMLGLMNAQLREAGFDRSLHDVALSNSQNVIGSLNASTLQPAGAQLAGDAPLFDVAPRHHLQATVGTQQWATELGNKLTMMATKDTQSATLYMTPADLGPVQVRIDLNQDQASVWFTAEHAETRSALEQSLPRLRELFSAQGMSLTDAGVFGDRSRQQQADSGFTSSRFHNMQYQDSEALADTATVRTISLGLLDAYA